MAMETFTFRNCTAALANGRCLHLSFTCYRYSESGVTQWVILEPLAAVLKGNKSNLDVHRFMRALRPSFGALLDRVGLSWEASVFPSLKALYVGISLGHSPQATPHNREAWCVSTEAFALVLAHMALKCRKQSRPQAVAVLVCWFQRCFDASVCDASLRDALHESRGKCDRVPDDEGVCSCMHLALASFGDVADASPHECASQHLCAWLKHVHACDACAVCVASFTSSLSREALARIDECEGASINPLKGERKHKIGGRRRRHDESFKLELTSGLVKKQKLVAGSAEAKVQGVDRRRFTEWKQRDLQTHVECARRSFQPLLGTFSTCEDAARLEKPAREIKTYALYHHEAGFSTWMANQAPDPSGCPNSNAELGFQFTPHRTRVPCFQFTSFAQDMVFVR